VKRYVEYSIERGGSVIVEADEPVQGLVPVASPGDVVVKSKEGFGAVLDNVKPIAETLLAKLQGLDVGPSEIGVEFGLNLGFKAGVVIAAGSTEANFKVSLKWTKQGA
jgi:Trypsin-co-occurring domain 1